MPALELHFFAADDPNGSTIFECSTDDQFLKEVKLDIQRDSLGSGEVSFARKVPAGGLFQRGIVEPEVLVRVLIPSVHATKYLHGFFINPRQQQVVSRDEKGGEGFTFAGPGPKHYLERMLLWSASFAGFDNAVERDNGIWTWPSTARAGAILNRLILEDQSNPSGPFLPDLTKSFSDSNDSDAVAWTDDIAGTADFTLKIQDDYLKILWILEDASGITTQIDLGSVGSPLLQLDAYQTFGRDLTGAIGAATVHLTEGVNIATDLDVEGSSYKKATHALVKGEDGVYELAVHPSGTAWKKVVATSYNSSNNTVLDQAGRRFLQRQDNGEKQIKVRIIPGFTPASGLYMPGPDGTDGHFWPGDTISLTTGQGAGTALDYSSEDQAVTGIEIELEEAVRDDTDLMAARSFIVTAVLNEERSSSNTSKDLAGTRGTTTPGPAQSLKLCALPTEGTSDVRRLYFSTDAATPGTITEDAAWADAASTGVRQLKSAPDGTFTGLGSGQSIFSGVNVPVSNRVVNLDRAAHAIQITDAALLSEVQAGGLVLQAQIRANSRYGIGVSEASQNDIAQWVWRVWRSGGTFVGTMFAAHAASSGTKFPAQATAVNRTFSGTASAVADAALNDWIILELGCRHLGPITGAGGASLYPASVVGVDDLPTDESTSTNLNSWVQLSFSGSGATPGDLPLDTVRQGDEQVGTSTRASRCDHQHAHGLLSADGTQYHELSQLKNYVFHAPAAPTVNDDGDDGYVQGTIWIDGSTGAVYFLTDPASGAAVWAPISNTGIIPINDLSDVVITAVSTGQVLQWDGSNWVNVTLPSASGIGEILITDTGASTPLVFADLIQNEAQDDLVYGDP
jgi:hypothetical protein